MKNLLSARESEDRAFSMMITGKMNESGQYQLQTLAIRSYDQ
jgi:hypothetical protein